MQISKIRLAEIWGRRGNHLENQTLFERSKAVAPYPLIEGYKSSLPRVCGLTGASLPLDLCLAFPTEIATMRLLLILGLISAGLASPLASSQLVAKEQAVPQCAV